MTPTIELLDAIGLAALVIGLALVSSVVIDAAKRLVRRR
jgi:hypothetical protein